MFHYQQDTMFCEQTRLADIAGAVGTPCYVYSTGSILGAYHSYDRAFGDLPHTVCFAVKANSSLAVLSLLAKAGSGFDIVSGGELYRVLAAGGDPAKVVFSGVGKTASEVEHALNQGIHGFNCESEQELALLDSIAGRLGKRVRFALRVNPHVDAVTHPYISTGLHDHKFGIDIREAESVYRYARRFTNLEAKGVSCHIGSQILNIDPLIEAADKAIALMQGLRAEGHAIEELDLGGGLGIRYRDSDHPAAIETLVGRLRDRILGCGVKVMVEPGRSIVGPAGVLLTRVLYRKRTPKKEFVIVDAAMNDLIRPSLYNAHHEILPVNRTGSPEITADVVGPVCESGDFLALGREVADAAPGDYLAVSTAGAYGFVQASNYNSRPRAAEVLVEGSAWRIVRQRESMEDLVRGEII